jgi:mannitol/fructose-specific phosphotransferase system IIA component (Ntr-type)
MCGRVKKRRGWVTSEKKIFDERGSAMSGQGGGVCAAQRGGRRERPEIEKMLGSARKLDSITHWRLAVHRRLLQSRHFRLNGKTSTMTLGNLLSQDQILPEMKATERWSAIVELVELLVTKSQIKAEDRDVVLGALRAREETMSTGIGFGIAIPHASSDRVGKVVAAFGRSSTGIEFDALDNAPVRFVVLFVVPKDQFQTHLRTLAAIAKFLNDRNVRERLGTAISAGDILAIFEDSGK